MLEEGYGMVRLEFDQQDPSNHILTVGESDKVLWWDDLDILSNFQGTNGPFMKLTLEGGFSWHFEGEKASLPSNVDVVLVKLPSAADNSETEVYLASSGDRIVVREMTIHSDATGNKLTLIIPAGAFEVTIKNDSSSRNAG